MNDPSSDQLYVYNKLIDPSSDQLDVNNKLNDPSSDQLDVYNNPGAEVEMLMILMILIEVSSVITWGGDFIPNPTQTEPD